MANRDGGIPMFKLGIGNDGEERIFHIATIYCNENDTLKEETSSLLLHSHLMLEALNRLVDVATPEVWDSLDRLTQDMITNAISKAEGK